MSVVNAPRETVKEYATEDWKTFVLREPDTFLGSGVLQYETERVFDVFSKTILTKSVFASQALKHTFTEALSNAQDSILRARSDSLPVSHINVRFINQKTIEIVNVGADIISVKKNDQGVWIPESVLGNLLSGSNSKAKNKTWVGKNGVGGTLVNIFSSRFQVEVWDHVRNLYYKQEWRNNAEKVTSEPEIVPGGKNRFENFENIPEDCGAVKVSFDIDLGKFVTRDIAEEFSNESIVKGFYGHSLMELYTRKVVDCSLATQVPVHFSWTDAEGNVVLETIFNIKNMTEYAELFFTEPPGNSVVYRAAFPKTWRPTKSEGVAAEIQAVIYDTPDEGFSFSFVNGQPTELGGIHVEEVCRAICNYVVELVEGESERDKSQMVKLTPIDIMNHLSVFVYATVPDPKFTGQTKGKLTSPKPAIRWFETDLEGIKDWSIIKAVKETLESKKRRLLSKTDGKKVRRINIPKAEDANMAGSTESYKCVLWLCEGDSAKNYALTLLENLPGGRNYNGIYPLSGKILNVMKANPEQMAKNKQVLELKVMLGLQEAVDYSKPDNYRQLRYGKVGVLTDMDMDGIHIRYLLTVFFGTRFAGILASGNMLTWMSPIIRAIRGKTVLRFFTMAEFHDWKIGKPPSEIKKWTIKYYKGLGGSTDLEVEEDVKNPHLEVTVYDEDADKSLRLAFDTKQIVERKKWINGVIRHVNEKPTQEAESREDGRVSGLTYDLQQETLGMFLNGVDATNASEDPLKRRSKKKVDSSSQQTLTRDSEISTLMLERKSITRGIHEDYMSFNLLTLKRAIPSEMDGLKTSERKILWTALKTLKDNEEIKTAQFGNIVAKETDYAHNEQILEKVISGMTQDFPTANNMPYFRGKGQFGSQYLPRASSGRYTHIEKSPWLRYIFREEDDHILPMVFDEGRETEPEHLIPIIPMTLVNGACGIANGFSTFIPQHNPLDIINSIEQRLSGEGSSENLLLSPWYRGHKGTVELLVEDTPEQRVLAMQSYGCYEELKDRTVITELPIGTYGEAYRKKLNMWRENFTKVRKQTLPGEKRETADETRVIKDFNNLCKKNVMRFEVTGMENPSYQALGLVKRLGMTNMTLLTTVSDNHTLSPTTVRGNTMEPYIPKRYESTEEYLDRFIKVRLYYYSIRKNYLVEKKKSELEVLKAKFRFIRDVVNKVVDVFGWKEQQILDKMAELGHPENLYSQTPIRRFCPEEVSRLESQIKVEEDNLKTLLSTESKQMWLTDLGELKDVYLKHYKGEDGIRKSQQRKIKLVKVKKGTIVEEDTIDDLLQVKDPQNNFEEETQDEYTE